MNWKFSGDRPVYQQIMENIRDWSAIKSTIKNDLSGYLYKTTKRNPMILPVISEI